MPKITESTPIWKEELCLIGECIKNSLKHIWSLPSCVPSGLAVECLLCHKVKQVKP